MKDLFVLDAQLATLDVETVEGSDDGIGIGGLTEVGESQTSEGTLLVEMVIESIGSWNREGSLWRWLDPTRKEEKQRTDDDVKEGFTFNIERDVLDYDSGGYNFVVRIGSHRGRDHWGGGVGRCRDEIGAEMTQGRRAARGRKIGGVVGRERTVVLGGFEPLLGERMGMGTDEDIGCDQTHDGETTADGLFERELADGKGRVLGGSGDGRGRLEVVLGLCGTQR